MCVFGESVPVRGHLSSHISVHQQGETEWYHVLNVNGHWGPFLFFSHLHDVTAQYMQTQQNEITAGPQNSGDG